MVRVVVVVSPELAAVERARPEAALLGLLERLVFEARGLEVVAARHLRGGVAAPCEREPGQDFVDHPRVCEEAVVSSRCDLDVRLAELSQQEAEPLSLLELLRVWLLSQLRRAERVRPIGLSFSLPLHLRGLRVVTHVVHGGEEGTLRVWGLEQAPIKDCV